MTNSKKKLVDSEPTLNNGGSITFCTSKPMIWYQTFEVFYYQGVESDNPDIESHWNDNKNSEEALTDTSIKYTNNKHSPVVSVTITLYHKTGTILVQGSSPSLQIWLAQHYPKLQSISARKRDETSKTDNVEDPSEADEATKVRTSLPVPPASPVSQNTSSTTPAEATTAENAPSPAPAAPTLVVPEVEVKEDSMPNTPAEDLAVQTPPPPSIPAEDIPSPATDAPNQVVSEGENVTAETRTDAEAWIWMKTILILRILKR